MDKQTICLDFDGVIHLYVSGWKGADAIPDDIVPNAINFLLENFNEYNLVIHSCRSHQEMGIAAMKSWLLEKFKKHFEENVGLWIKYLITPNRLLETINFPLEKPPAIIYIDDRGFCFKGEFPSKEYVDKFKPWNKK